ncbi:hypothetical protein C1N91_15715 [Curtobacterium sp. SGAir0471]|uniref:hypothetical protein n=1 Tax=Curtobacterium sp. SGAir0471 TaxID=2070337 RepID=UPI0010CD624E|nr:hypothetical protein [Curtobacterium sp. SGAir0471]QCR44766.1 hypothetical protein C1N91_15715 [Curtobacterium sp. SGAir0471]
MSRRPTRRDSLTPAVLIGCAALVMAGGRVVPALREVPVVVWVTSLALLVVAGLVVIRNRRPGDR